MGRGPDPANRIDNRQRGNAHQLLDKYRTLARDAQSQGDRITAEYYLQYADHYYRVLNDNRPREENRDRRPQREWQDRDDRDFPDERDERDGEIRDEREARSLRPAEPGEREERRPRRDRMDERGLRPRRERSGERDGDEDRLNGSDDGGDGRHAGTDMLAVALPPAFNRAPAREADEEELPREPRRGRRPRAAGPVEEAAPAAEPVAAAEIPEDTAPRRRGRKPRIQPDAELNLENA